MWRNIVRLGAGELDGVTHTGYLCLSCGGHRDIAKQYALKGATVVIAARSQEKLEALRASMLAEGAPGPIHIVPADLSTEQASKQLIEQV